MKTSAGIDRRTPLVILKDGDPFFKIIEGLPHDISDQQFIADVRIEVRLVGGV